MRTATKLAAALMAALFALEPVALSAQPIFPPGGRPHRVGPGGPGPGPGPGWGGPVRHRPPIHHHGGGGYDPGAAVAAGVIGLAAGAIIAGAAADGARGDRHVQRCLNRYRSYDPSTDTYIGNDGRARRCRL
ncbi:MAG: BA14K family protein [Siculibacillus sp.]